LNRLRLDASLRYRPEAAMKKLRLALIALLLTLFAAQSAGCNRYGWHVAGEVIEAAVTVAAISYVLSYHDPAQCSRRTYWVHGRECYRCGDRWEYYDEYEDQWYYYEDVR